MDFSKVRYSRLFLSSIAINLFLSLSLYIFYSLEYLAYSSLIGSLLALWIQVGVLLSKTYFLCGKWRANARPGLIITVLSFFIQASILVYYSFFQMNLPFLIGFFIANYFTMKIFVSTAYILLKYEPKNV